MAQNPPAREGFFLNHERDDIRYPIFDLMGDLNLSASQAGIEH